MSNDKPRYKTSFKKAISTIAEIVTDAIPAVVSLYDPVLAIPAGAVSTILKNILTNIIESEHKNTNYVSFVTLI